MDRLVLLCKKLRDDARRQREDIRDLRNYRTLQFRLGITMAHELIHGYNYYLQRDRNGATPPDLRYGPYGDSYVGESGRVWEAWVLGGFVDMRMDLNSREYCVAIRDEHNRHCWVIKDSTIETMLRRDFNRWLEPGSDLKDPEHGRGRVTQEVSPMAWKEVYGDVLPHVPTTAELPPSLLAWLTGVKVRRLPEFDMCGADLRAFSLGPGLARVVRVR